MNSRKVSPSQSDDSIPSSTIPGSWFQRKLHNFWYLPYGLLLVTAKLKIAKEVWTRNRSFDPRDETTRPGAVVVITGGPRGIASPLARKFLELDFTVIMGCQNVNSSQKKVDEMRKNGVLSGSMHLLPLNLKSLTSTKEFANSILKMTNQIDLLINNAGIMMTPYEFTEDGFEAQFQVNYLSHFLLTMLLLPTMKRTAEKFGRDARCRIINTSSVYHHAGNINLDNLERRKVYVPTKCYFDSKLCQVLFTKQLEKRLQKERINIQVLAVHPGAIPSDLLRNAGLTHRTLSYLLKPILPNLETGADTIMHAALSSTLDKQGGSYLEAMKIAKSNTQRIMN